MKTFAFFAFVFVLLFNFNSQACVTFVINSKDSLVFGWNYEFDCGSGFLIVNKKGLLKTSFVQPDEKPIEWISKFGSLTFNQFGREFPAGGINEKGLVVVQTMYTKTQYPERDNRSSITELQWIQYQLDNFSSIQEVIESDKFLRISNNSVPLHFMICDKAGNIAIIEFLEGKMVHFENDKIIYPVMGNDSYKNSLSEITKYKGFGGNETIPQNSTDIKNGNFIFASDFVKKYNNQKSIVDYSFNILSHSSELKRTQWSVVFDVSNGKANFKSLNNRQIKTVSLKDFNFDCNQVAKLIDVSANTNTDFVNYTKEINALYVNKAYDDPAIPWIKEMVPPEVNHLKILYPETLKCLGK